MITCNIIYDDEAELPNVIYLRKVLNEVHNTRFFFASRTYKFKPIPEKHLEKVKL